MKKLSLPFIGFLQASGFTFYLIILSLFLNKVAVHFTPSANAEFYMPIIMLLIFVVSAVISATLFLGRAGVFFWNKKYKEAFKLLGFTIFWTLVYLCFLILLSQRY